jgi:hypothetical protein
MYPRILVPPTTLAIDTDLVPPWGSREHCQMSYDDDTGLVFVEHESVYGNTRKVAAAIYLGISMIEVRQMRC